MYQILNLPFIFLILFYKKFISPFMRPSCRYYPSCSSYCISLFRFSNPIEAIFRSLVRILRCNQFFKGGFDYPKANVHLANLVFTPIKISYWIVPIIKFDRTFSCIAQNRQVIQIEALLIESILRK